MGIVNSKKLLTKGLRALFMKALDNGENPADVMSMITQTASTSDRENYAWLGQVAQVTEWVDERKLRGLIDFEHVIVNRRYESTLQVDRDAMDDDQLGGTNIRIRDLVRRARLHPRKLFFDALISATTDLSYDGVPLISASHQEGSSGVQSNIVTGTSSTVMTVAELETDFCNARERLRSFVDDQAEPRNEGELNLTVVAPNKMECVIDKLLISDEISSTTNTLKGAAKKLVTQRLGLGAGNVHDWYLIDTTGEIQPFIMQMRKNITFDSLEEDSDAGFMRAQFLFGVDYRVGFGTGGWWKIVKVNNSQ